MNSSRSILIICLLASCSLAFGQGEYIVTVKGDTIKGPVKILTYDIDKVQVSINGKKKILPAVQVRTIFLKNELYNTVRRQDGYQIMKPVKTGYLSMYNYREPNQSNYTGTYLYKKDGKSTDLPNLTFKKSMTEFLSDCPEVSAKIKVGDLGRRDVEKIVDDYNACIVNRTKINDKAPEPVPVVASNARTIALDALEKKVQSTDLKDKSDALDLISDIRQKLNKGQQLPAYLVDGLKNYLGHNEEIKPELDALIAAIAAP